MRYIKAIPIILFTLWIGLKESIQAHADGIKHATDAAVLTTGLGTMIAYWMDKLVNPILSGILIITTIIYTYYRIQDLRRKPVEDDETRKD